MKIYLTRHGETVWNVLNKTLGRTDIPLNEKGREQAEALGEKLRNTRLDLIISSPLSRATDTAKSVLKYHDGCDFKVDDRLIEQNYGVYEGIDRADKDYQKSKRNYFSRRDGGESYFDVAYRVYSLIDELKSQEIYENVLIVTHGAVSRIITNYFINMDNEEFTTFFMRNCEVREFEI